MRGYLRLRGHLRHLLLQIAILCIMGLVAFISENLFVVLVIGAVLASLPIVWVAAGLLLWTSHKAPEIESLEDAADNMVTVALSTSVAGVIAAVVLARLLGFIGTSVGTFITVGLGYVLVANMFPAIRSLQTWGRVWLPRARDRL